jgi:hypothetical protein
MRRSHLPCAEKRGPPNEETTAATTAKQTDFRARLQQHRRAARLKEDLPTFDIVNSSSGWQFQMGSTGTECSRNEENQKNTVVPFSLTI